MGAIALTASVVRSVGRCPRFTRTQKFLDRCHCTRRTPPIDVYSRVDYTGEKNRPVAVKRDSIDRQLRGKALKIYKQVPFRRRDADPITLS